jgi:hypothetical protein
MSYAWCVDTPHPLEFGEGVCDTMRTPRALPRCLFLVANLFEQCCNASALTAAALKHAVSVPIAHAFAALLTVRSFSWQCRT